MTEPPSRPTPDGSGDILAGAPYRIGAVTLVAHDVEALTRFYCDAIGLEEITRESGTVRLGVGDTVLLVLRHDPSARRWASREAGLFHTAFLLPGRGDLGAWLQHAEGTDIRLTGAADHRVSEAIYLDDPEGNDIEIYVDRPSPAWPHAADGTVVMGNDRLDRDGLVREAERPWDGMPTGGSVGHVHLQVGELDAAESFYAGLLGFDATCRYPGALFLGSGGYHHQLAGNVWNSRGAPVRSESTTGLGEVGLLAEEHALTAARIRFREAGLPFTEEGENLLVQDCWGTRLRLALAPRR